MEAAAGKVARVSAPAERWKQQQKPAGAVIAGAVAAISMLNSATGENINVSAATGGGGVTTPTPTNQYSSANMQQNKPVIVHIDNRFDVGNRGAATISTKQAISTGPYDKNN